MSESKSASLEATAGARSPMDAVYEILCGLGAHESDIDQWHHFWNDPENTEYRFCGLLGFGGKFWRTRREWYVNCYPEDETTERAALIRLANRALSALRDVTTDAGHSPRLQDSEVS